MSTADQARRRRDEIRAGTYERPERALDLPWPRSDGDGTPLGVDLEAEWDLVRAEVRLVCRIPPAGLTWGDLVQEVCLAIVRRNRMPSAHDPRRSSMRHYVRLVARNVISHHCDRTVLPVTLDPLDEERLPCPPDESWRSEALEVVRELQASGRLSPVAAQYTGAVLCGEDTAQYGSPWRRGRLREELRLGVLGAVGP